MNFTHRLLPFLCALLLLLTIASPSIAAEPLSLLIVDGQNNHDWQHTTPYLQGVLEETERFTVDTVTTPPKGAEQAAWEAFDPQFADYDVVLLNYNGETWPEEDRQRFEAYIKGGGGLINVHAANNPFPDWPAFNEMIGLGWRGAGFGDRLVLDNEGNEFRQSTGDGPGAGHGPRYPYPVIVRDKQHPVMKGMPLEWLHPTDELYHGQRGPATNMHILATAYSLPYKKGTGYHEPMVWWIPFGEGRVFTTVLGHVGKNQKPEEWAMRCLGFQAIVTRGAEWAATGEVTIPLPDKFPTPEGVSLAPPASMATSAP